MSEAFEASSYTIQVFASLLFGALQILLVILLVNLLVAMMSNTYDGIETENENEWLVAQSGLLNDFALKIRGVSDLPLFNIVGLGWKLLRVGKLKHGLQRCVFGACIDNPRCAHSLCR